jgi:hypothetical protein
VATVGQAYSETVTILAPPTFVYLGNSVPINKIVLNDVQNLPPGISFVTNATANTFYPGTRYCILLSGNPTLAGTFTLKIRVGAYITFLGNPVYVGEQVDSTSLSMTVIPSTSIDNPDRAGSTQVQAYPNPFSTGTRLAFIADRPGLAELELINMLGEVVYRESLMARAGTSNFLFDGNKLSPGVYHANVTCDDIRVSTKIIKSNP